MTGLHPNAVAQQPSGSQLELVGTNIVSVGTIPCYKMQSVPFRLVNRSNKAITISRLKPTCVCIEGEKNKDVVPPGEEAVVTLHLDPIHINGPFQRGVWVVTSDTSHDPIKLLIEGDSVPLFKGAPTTRLSYQTATLGVAWTNSFTIEATEPALRLGPPVFETNANLNVTLALVTNRAEKASYQATLIVTPLALGRHTTLISMPVEGKNDMPPVTFNLLVNAGLALSAAPDKMFLAPSDTPVTRRVLLHTQEEVANPKNLTWSPSDEGLRIRTKTNKANIMTEVQFSPEAIRRLLAMKEPALTFSYTNYESVVIQLLPATEAMAADSVTNSATENQTRSRLRRSVHSSKPRSALVPRSSSLLKLSE